MIIISFQRKHAYVSMPDGSLLCIGREDDVNVIDAIKLWDMIAEAIAINKYHAIASAQKMIRH